MDNTLKTITYPSGRVITYTVSNAERYLTAADSSAQYAMTASYAPPGGLSSVIYGKGGSFNGITQQNAYNSRLEPTSTQASSSAGTAENLSFCFGTFSFTNGCSSQTTNNNGTVSGITNNAASGLSEALSYDSLNRILSGETQSNSANGCWGETFGSSGVPDDRYSNLSQITVSQCTGGGLSVTVSPTTNQVVTSGYSYNADGDMTSDASYTYTYDAENRITSASGMANGPYCYVYDGNGMRVEKFHANGGTCANPTNKVVDRLYWRSISGPAIAETDGSGDTLNEYVFFAGQRIAGLDSSGNVYFYYTDQIGSTVAIATGSGTGIGTPCYEATFTPYGEEHATQTTCSTNYKFAGYERDPETGLDYAFARYYNLRLGRFMTPDPIGLASADATDPQTLNAYALVRNTPTSLIDPLGLQGGPTVSTTLAQACTDGGILVITTFYTNGASSGVCINSACPSGSGTWRSLAIPDSAMYICGGSTDMNVEQALQNVPTCEFTNSCSGGGGGNNGGSSAGPKPTPPPVAPKPQTPTHPYLTCVANSGNEASLQGLLGLGNSKIAGVFLGNPLSDFIQAATGGGGSPAAADAGLYAATKAAPAVPNVAVSYTSTTITASPSEFSIITSKISAYLPLGDIASGAADVLGGFTKLVQAPIDITASAFGAVTCAAGE